MIIPDGYSDIPAGKIAAIVTHLEMTARPAHRDELPGTWTLRKADAPALAWYRDLFRRVGEDWLWFSRARMSDAELAAIIHTAGIEIYALVVDGREEGLLELDFRKPGQCELVYFGVTASLIGTGAARFLMNRALERAWRGDVRRVWVHTCTFDHPSAVAFYQRSGFRPFRRQVEVADDPRLDGTLSRDAAKHVPIVE
ncbi:MULTISPECIES: GNAT family N-acetyltransferase [unclassified Bradyrhizobium]|uniref:GNAT family N-acetyltransferase n=1 Tax=unclassified Bradyrhizobium TaxID=2631580 RepID=UPI0020B33DA8|nr:MULTISPECIES: GNAT family N-acetyltransferase [unclassified Bradyrhizobium]MCP3385902.1 GNAT family N-acetyltransferase [Bradyrhizobium sp. CCGUVB4N]MCP3447166.1 GNAT family N-acetyltransferase [Bradyrhizobium sp. CCGUVB14]